MSRTRIGLIGCGVVSQSFILPHTTQEAVRDLLDVVAVCDVDGTRAERTARTWGVPRWYVSHQEMLQSEQLDGVLIASPIPYHYEQALAALRSGHHVYVQKTMAETSKQAEELVEAAKSAERVLVASPVQMLSYGYQAIQTALGDEVLGKVFWAFGSVAFPGHEHSVDRKEIGADPAWFYQRGSGPLRDMGVYVLDTLTGILGPVRAVTAMFGKALGTREWGNRNITVDIDDSTLLLLEFARGTLGFCGAHYCYAGPGIGWGFLGFYGSKGSVEIAPAPRTSYPGMIHSHPEDLALALSGPIHTAPLLTTLDMKFPSYQVWADVRYFLDCVLGGRDSSMHTRRAVHVIEVIEKSALAASTGQTQRIESRL